MELKEHQVPVARQERENFKKEQGINCPQSTASVCNSVVSPCLQGFSGEPGPKGPDGPPGIIGEDGGPGDDGVLYL